MKTSKWQAKDLITIGLYTILIYIIHNVISIILSPIMLYIYPYMSGICLFFSSIVYLLMAIRVGKKGTLLLMATVTGFIYTLMGAPLMLPFFIVAGIVGELTLLSGDGTQYRQVKRQAVAYGIYGILFGSGAFVMIYVLGTEFFESMKYTKSFIDRILEYAYSPLWMASGLAASFFLSWLGCMISKGILSKHFVKAGYISYQS
ncbi:MptD family putative ECF transporter S component [Lysinibacillus sp. FSL K6-0075]|jgi:energy-coupling factor transport system substrate-specific component|uniref:MptD family putative ECF transporter S component n=1 Tax=Lysinibacillus sp. FSL K6-0075 TaxID=2921415 RepID=UPI003157F9A4